jgi:hypothetical protein
MSGPGLLERLHGPTAAGVPRWAVVTAYLTSLTVLPSSVWRIVGFAFGAPVVERVSGHRPGEGPSLIPDSWMGVYVVGLSIVSEALAFLALGLVCRWGEVFPRWIPRLGGRTVPVRAAVIPAAVGSTLLMIFPYALFMHYVLDSTITGVRHGGGLVTHGWQSVAFAAAYLPLAAWGPLLAVLTVHYHRRRTGRTASGAGSRPAVAVAAKR